ncbi:hypothetical protein [Paraburkholderia sp.]|uniref:hypothetical protein n=1 Tax=Paraburkholderia sp. TaxID=1926495 RepID=UPI002397CD11|nr:hypothetical protein [Paraburkholderia sp.]MDE1182476.1 hypothetical protein [Paraburkholderia sp.]
MKDLFIVGSAFAAALLFYLCSPGQRWLRAPLPPRHTRVLAAMCVIASFATAADALHPAASLSLLATVIVATLAACPYIGVLVERMRVPDGAVDAPNPR